SQCTRDKCRSCGGKHHSLLHEERAHASNSIRTNECSQPTSQAVAPSEGQTLTCSTVQSASDANSQCLISNTKGHVLLATAKVILESRNGQRIEIKALLDSASQTSLVTSDVVKRLKAKALSTNLQISGISQTRKKVSEKVDILLKSKHSSNSNFNVTCGVVDNITCELPQIQIDTAQLKIPSNITLADNEFHIPSKIQMLIGADLYYDLIEPGIIRLGSDLPIVVNSKLGWILGGSIKCNSQFESSVSQCNVILFTQTLSDINHLIPKFWQMEEISTKRILSIEDKICENLFSTTTTQSPEGKFIVNLPLKNSLGNLGLGDSFEFAKRRFLSSNSLEGLSRLCKELVDLLGLAGFQLHKWVSNVDRFEETNYSIGNFSNDSKGNKVRCLVSNGMEGLVSQKSQNISSNCAHVHIDTCLSKVLGIVWQPSLDYF
ncbi:hypothetical protein NQ318_006591, partial [Aromia moschata]